MSCFNQHKHFNNKPQVDKIVCSTKLREEYNTSDYNSTINSQLGWHPL